MKLIVALLLSLFLHGILILGRGDIIHSNEVPRRARRQPIPIFFNRSPSSEVNISKIKSPHKRKRGLDNPPAITGNAQPQQEGFNPAEEMQNQNIVGLNIPDDGDRGNQEHLDGQGQGTQSDQGNRYQNEMDGMVRVKPIYPLISRRLGEEGIVMVKVNCQDTKSCLYDIVKSSGHDRLDSAVRIALRDVQLADAHGKVLRFIFQMNHH